MEKRLLTTGSYLSVFASVLCIVTGQFLLAAVMAFVGTWGFLSQKPSKGVALSQHKPIPSVENLKQFRKENPNLSFTEAVATLQHKEN